MLSEFLKIFQEGEFLEGALFQAPFQVVELLWEALFLVEEALFQAEALIQEEEGAYLIQALSQVEEHLEDFQEVALSPVEEAFQGVDSLVGALFQEGLYRQITATHLLVEIMLSAC